jgi:hypothetical protein
MPLLGNFLDQLIHPGRAPKDDAAHDPGKPFTPPPPQPSKAEQDDEDDDGPNFPMDPALA